jgi:ATP synthase I subunit
MAENEERFYESGIRRITWIILALGIAGAAALTPFKGFRFGLGFLVGAGFSYLSFWRWQRVLQAIGPSYKPQSSWTLMLRILLLIAAAYAIIKFLELSIAAAALGLLVAAAAVIVEIIYELIYARA